MEGRGGGLVLFYFREIYRWSVLIYYILSPLVLGTPHFSKLHFPHFFYIENDGFHLKDPDLVLSSFSRDNSSALYKVYLELHKRLIIFVNSPYTYTVIEIKKSPG
jgi:hypothetical protein